jgi:hypothetical protein
MRMRILSLRMFSRAWWVYTGVLAGSGGRLGERLTAAFGALRACI